MPEMPEMETYRQLLTPLLVGKQVEQVIVEREKSINTDTAHFRQKVKGTRIVRIDRRAKHLIFVLDTGDVLLLHLMLGGWMFFGTDSEKSERSAQVTLLFGEKRLFFHGLRLGYLHLYTIEEGARKLADLGPEPFDRSLSAVRFRELVTRRRGLLKPVLVDQRVIAGIGNCYSDEICFDAEIRPSRSILSLKDEEWLRLYEGMRSVLNEAVQYGGYMENPLFVGDMRTGRYNNRCKVYDCENQPCVRCGQPIVREDFASRKSFHCAKCQK